MSPKRAAGFWIVAAAMAVALALLPWRSMLDTLGLLPDPPSPAGRIRVLAAEVRLAIAEDGFSGRVALELGVADVLDDGLILPLNDGLTVGRAYIDGEVAQVERRPGVIRLATPRRLGPGPHHVEVEYATAAGWQPPEGAVFTEAACILPEPAHWAPLPAGFIDLLDVRAELPRGWRLAGGLAEEGPAHSVSARPVNAPAFVAGRFDRDERLHAGRAFTLLTSPGEPAPLEGVVQDIFRAHDVLAARYGDTGLGPLQVVLSGALDADRCAGNGIVLLRAPLPADAARRFAGIADAMAGLWFGRTVAMPPRGDGQPPGLVAGLRSYAAWRARIDVRGEGEWAALREQAALHAREPAPGEPEAAALFRLADEMGPDQLDAVLREILLVHRHRAISDAVLHAEVARVAPGTLPAPGVMRRLATAEENWAIEGVWPEEDTVRITVSRQGPAHRLGTTAAYVTTEGRVVRQAVEARAGEVVLTVEPEAPVARVVLDPAFLVNDTDRSDNIWPRALLPLELAAAEGHVALLGTRDFAQRGVEAGVYVKAEGSYEWAELPAPGPVRFAWGPAEERLVVSSDPPWVWQGRFRAVAAGEGLRLLTLTAGGRLFDAPRGRRWVWAPSDGGETISQPWTGRPPGRRLALRPGHDALAWVEGDGRTLRLLDIARRRERALAELPAPVVALAWDGPGALVAIDATWQLYEVDETGAAMPGRRLPTYAAAAWLFDGGALAWWDGRSTLHLGNTAGDRQAVALEGRPVDVDWPDPNGAVYGLVAALPGELPLRSLATHRVLRIDPATGAVASDEAFADTL